MSAQNSAGIQTLLEAEKDAQKIVEKSRTYRTQRLKDARTEGQREIEEYRKKKEEEFQHAQSKDTGSNTKVEEEADKGVQSALQSIKEAAAKSSDAVVEDLLKAVASVTPHAHRNVKPSAA